MVEQTRQRRGKRVGKQVPTRRTKQLADPAETVRAEHRQSNSAFDQVERQARKGRARGKQQPQQQHGEGLHGDWNWSKAERYGDMGADRNQGRSRYNGETGLQRKARYLQPVKPVLLKAD